MWFLGHSFVNRIFASNTSLQSDVSELSFCYQELFVMRQCNINYEGASLR